MRSVGLFVLKSVGFSAIFWAVWTFVFLPINTRMSNTSNTTTASSQGQQDDGAALMKRYWAQAAEADAIQNNYKRQAVQADEQLKTQAELLQRWEKIIQRWEKVAPK